MTDVSPTPRRTRLVLLSFAIVIVLLAAGTVVALHRAPWPPVMAQTTLPDGTRLRLRGVQQAHKVDVENHPGYWRAVWLRLPPLVQRHLPGGIRIRNSQSNTQASNTVHFLFDAVSERGGAAFVPEIASAALGDATSASSSVHNHRPEVIENEKSPTLVWCNFETVPRRALQWVLAVTLSNGQTGTFTLPNPWAVTNAPSWTGKPVPQSITNGVRVVTLREMSLTEIQEPRVARRGGALQVVRATSAPAERGSGKWNTSIWLQATESGVPLDAFRIRPQLEDESGNQSDRFVAATEPVWKVTTVTVETEKYPFPPAAVRSFQCAMPAPGATVQVPLTPQDEADGLSVILVAGKGTHRFNAAKMTLEPASGTGSLAGPAHFTIDSFGVFVHSATSMAASDWSNEQLRLVRFRPGSDGPWRRHEMDGASTSWGRGSAEASVMLNWDIHSSAAPPPGTLCEFQFIRLHPQTNEFYVTNPLLKSGPAAATSATP